MKNFSAWLRYLTVWLDAPAKGKLEDADCIIVQAFGRNTIPDRALFKVGEIAQEECHDYCRVNSIFSKYPKFDTGLANRYIANACKQFIEEYDIPVIIQWEIAFGFDPHWYLKNQSKIFCIWPPSTKQARFDTTHVTKQVWRIMQEHNLTTPIVLAHDRMLVRGALIVKKITGIDPIITSRRVTSWDKKSVQYQTRGPFNWYWRETLTRLHHIITKRVW